jgi:hypothetical protein
VKRGGLGPEPANQIKMKLFLQKKENQRSRPEKNFSKIYKNIILPCRIILSAM